MYSTCMYSELCAVLVFINIHSTCMYAVLYAVLVSINIVYVLMYGSVYIFTTACLPWISTFIIRFNI